MLISFLENLMSKVETLIEGNEHLFKNVVKFILKLNTKLLDILNTDPDLVLSSQNQMHLVKEYLKSSVSLGNLFI